MNKITKELIDEIYKNTNIDLDYINIDEVSSFDELVDELENNNAFDNEVIGYYLATEYLLQNDPSLKNSLELASEYGYNIDNIGSELLATLLINQEYRSEFENYRDELDELLTK